MEKETTKDRITAAFASTPTGQKFRNTSFLFIVRKRE